MKKILHLLKDNKAFNALLNKKNIVVKKLCHNQHNICWLACIYEHPKEKGGGNGGGRPNESTVSHGNEASWAPAIHASERRWTALSCLTGHDHTFPLWMPSCRAMGYKSKGNGKSWGDGACRRGYGRPERERPHMTSLFLLWLLLHPIPLPGSRLPV